MAREKTVQVKKPEVINTSLHGRATAQTKHQFMKLVIDGITEDSLEVAITPGQLGVSRIIGLNPQPLKAHFSVVWNGDSYNPVLSFDGAPEKGAEVLIEVWGA